METVRLLPLEGAAAPLGVHLILAEGGGPTPFQMLSADEDLSRVYLAAIKGDEQSVVEFAALKVLPWGRPALPGGFPLGNRDLEGRWETERGRLVRFRKEPAFFPRLVALDEPAGADQHRLPPLFYCKTARLFFSPPCPTCLARLSTCRDDALLTASGLPGYGSSLDRFLYCPECAADPAKLAFYSAEPMLGGRVPVRSARQLADELAAGLAGTWDHRWVAAFPCRDCRDDARRENVADRWIVLSLYDSPYLLTGLSPLNAADLGDLLGGRTVESFLSGAAKGEGAAPPQSSGLAARETAPIAPLRHAWLGTPLADGPGRLLFSHDASGLDAVEVLLLKIVAFRQAVQALLHYYRLVGRPHLDLHPRHLLYDLSGAGSGLPLLWTFQVRLQPLGAMPQEVHTSPGSPPLQVIVPPANPVVPYAPPEIVEYHLAGVRPAELVLADVAAAETGGFRVLAGLNDPYGLFPDPDDRDLVVVSVENDGLDLGFRTLAGRVSPAGDGSGRGRSFTSEPLELSEAARRRLQRTLGARIPGVRYKVYPDFGPPSDLHSMGVCLLGLLVANDSQDVASVMRAIGRALPARGAALPPERMTLSAILERNPELKPLLSRSNVFHAAVERVPGRPNAIPEPLWARAVGLALRLVSRLPGFSFAADHADFDPTYPGRRLEVVLQEAEALEGELRSTLFSSQSVNLEVQQILLELAAEESRST